MVEWVKIAILPKSRLFVFTNFDISFSDSHSLDSLARLGLTVSEVEQVFYGEYHVLYLGDDPSFLIGYTGSKMLTIDFYLDIANNKIIIEEIIYSKPNELDELYRKPRCK